MLRQEQRASTALIALEDRYGAHNYLPLPIVVERAEGVWVHDVDGKRYLDCLSSYSAVNLGHGHPRLINALTEQAGRVTLTSRAFRNDQLPYFCQEVSELTAQDVVLPMNTGAEAVETAIKAARRWGYRVKGIAADQAEIIVCEGNFHGRTTTVVGFSSEAEYRRDFGPFAPGFRIIPYGDIDALQAAITGNTCGFMLEPIQCEAGIRIPPDGYLRAAADLCRERNVLFIVDEIQTGLGRTGELFACDREQVRPDLIILGKALSGGVYPVSAVAGRRDVMELFEPGSHGSTYGGNPLGCAVARAAIAIMQDEKLPEHSAILGARLLVRLQQIAHPAIKEVRGRGLLVGIELNEPARPWCERLADKGLLCKETHGVVIRLAPPLVISDEELDWMIEVIEELFAS
ncbi:MAG TPA: ornithine--oxo-acid transaminase [Gemmatimonadales bacterium]|nr:ornithine--oxo-acid transaminase [Gemmatimonadales bacterium]